VDGTVPLADVWAAVTRYVAFPDRASIMAVVLWVVHTWLSEEFDSTPRLSVPSPEKESGKTRLLEVLVHLCREAGCGRTSARPRCTGGSGRGR
jgi:hypothetical protein